MSESDLVQAILLEFGARPGLRIWRHNVGAAKTRTGAVVKFGTRGQPDIMGIMAPSGKMIAIECKAGRGVLSKEQRLWRAMFEAHGGLYIEARSVADVEESLRYGK